MSPNKLILLSFALILPAAMFAGQLDTFPTWNGVDTIGDIGYPDTSTYGEAITTPAGAGSVDDFSFWLSVPVGFQFQAFISPWDNINYQLTGSPLYLSSVVTATDAGLDEYTFTGVNATAIPGVIYQFGVTINNVYGNDSTIGTGVMGGDFESNGNSTNYFDWNNDGGNNTLLYQNWNNTGCADNGGACGQARFVVDYSAGTGVPEPGTFALLGLALLPLVKIQRRPSKR